MSQKITIETTVVKWGLELKVEITGTYSPGRPGVHTLRNGDPGYPADPAEFNVEKVELLGVNDGRDGEDVLIPETGEFYEEFMEEIDRAVEEEIQRENEAAAEAYADDAYERKREEEDERLSRSALEEKT